MMMMMALVNGGSVGKKIPPMLQNLIMKTTKPLILFYFILMTRVIKYLSTVNNKF